MSSSKRLVVIKADLVKTADVFILLVSLLSLLIKCLICGKFIHMHSVL